MATVAHLEGRLDEQGGRIDALWDVVRERLDAVARRVDALGALKLDVRVLDSNHGNRIASLETRVDRLDQRQLPPLKCPVCLVDDGRHDPACPNKVTT